MAEQRNGAAGLAALVRPGRAGHSAAVRDAAFLVYLGAGKRSLTQTSHLTGINRETLGDWAKREDWEGRIADGFAADAGAVGNAVDLARALFPTLVRAASDRMLAILADPGAHQPTQARLIELALGLAGVVVPKAPSLQVERDDDGRTRVALRVSDLSAFTARELANFRDRGAVPSRFLPTDDPADDPAEAPEPARA